MRTKNVLVVGISGEGYLEAAKRHSYQMVSLGNVDEALLRLKAGSTFDLTLVVLTPGATSPHHIVQPLRVLSASGALAVVTDSEQFSFCAKDLMESGVAEVLPGPLTEASFEALLMRASRVQELAAQAAIAPVQALSASAEDSRKVTFLVGQPLHEMEQEMLVRTLEMTNGNRTRAASILGISVRTLYSKLLEIEQQRKMASAKNETPKELSNRGIATGSRHNLASV